MTSQDDGETTAAAEQPARLALASGDLDQAIELLHDLYSRRIARYCRGMLGDEALAEDAWQETFVQAYRDLATFQGRASLRAWLSGIAWHRCMDAARKRQRERRRLQPLAEPDDDERPPEVSEPHDLDRPLESARVREAFLICLGRLAPRARSTLTLRFELELSIKEIVAITGEQAATLSMRVSRALPQLRVCLQEHGVRYP